MITLRYGAFMSPPAEADAVHRRRRWAKTNATRQRILQSATSVFSQRGYSAATIGDVVSASGASIGSIYHHFGGKSELFTAIHEEMTAVVAHRIDSMCGADTTLAGRARAYLEAIWAYRDTAMVLSADDVPPGFDRLRREAMRSRFQGWVGAPDSSGPIAQQMRIRLVIAVLTESAAMVMVCADADAARPVIDTAIDYLSRLQ